MSIGPLGNQAIFNAGNMTSKEMDAISRLPPEKQAEAMFQLQMEKEKNVTEMISKMLKTLSDTSQSIVRNM
jgi:hypothetical protein